MVLICFTVTNGGLGISQNAKMQMSFVQNTLRNDTVWKAKVTSSLTDVWQQWFEQQDITVIGTIHCHPWLRETTPVHQRLETPTETGRHAATCLSETSEGRQ